MEKIRVVIADDQAIFRDGLQLVLSKMKGIEVVGEAENGAVLVQQVETLRPDVVLADVVMPMVDGIEATKSITDQHPEIGVIALSMFDEEERVMEMIEAGALGYLVKNADKAELYTAIQTVNRGQPYYCRHTHYQLTKMISRGIEERRMQKVILNEKELQIVIGICEELNNKEMAAQFYMSRRTIDGYRSRILEKLGVKGAVGVVKYAIKEGIYKLENGS